MSLSRNIANIIVQKGVKVADVEETLRSYKLLSLLPSIKKAVVEMYREKDSKESIVIESPFPLDDIALSRIKRIVGNDLAPHTFTINKNLLAGFKARYKGKLYDGSAQRIIKRFTSATNN